MIFTMTRICYIIVLAGHLFSDIISTKLYIWLQYSNGPLSKLCILFVAVFYFDWFFFSLHIFATNFLCKVFTLYMWVRISPTVRLFLSLSLLQPDVGKHSHIPEKKLTCFKCQIATRRLIIRVQEHPVSHLCPRHKFRTLRKVNKKQIQRH